MINQFYLIISNNALLYPLKTRIIPSVLLQCFNLSFCKTSHLVKYYTKYLFTLLMVYFFLSSSNYSVRSRKVEIWLFIHQNSLRHIQLFSRLIMSHYLLSHGLQHASLPCPSLCPGVSSNSCSLRQWYHPTTSSSVTPFSSYSQSFLTSRSFPMSQLFFPSGGPNIGASPSMSVLPMNIQG